jgi:hypothetical protein
LIAPADNLTEGTMVKTSRIVEWLQSRLGPRLRFFASIAAVKKLLDGSIPVLPRFGFNVVDVRDIARLHVLAMTTPELRAAVYRLRRFLLDVRRR